MNLIERFRRFMYGRYGFDQLGSFLFLLSFVFWGLCFILRFTPLYKAYYFFSLLNTAMYVIAIFRILSRNTYKRTVENEKFLRIRSRVIPFLNKHTMNLKDKNYVYKKCPYCKTQLRLKRIKGKHTSRCPKCGTTFKIRIFFENKNKYY